MSRPRPDTSVVKRCSRCKESLPRAMFTSTKGTFDQLLAYCRPCAAARQREHRSTHPLPKEYLAAASRKWRAANPRLAKDHALKSRYGIPLGTYDRLLVEQRGRCAICQGDNAGGRGDFHVDHCHDTGAIRGLLCHGCNVSIGHFKHDESILLSAVKYLAERRGKGG